MSESVQHNTMPNLGNMTRISNMSATEKASFWALPLIAAIPALMFSGMLLVLLIKFRHNSHQVNLYVEYEFIWTTMAATLIIWCLPAVFIWRIFRRKKKTGDFLPTGDELQAIRDRRKEPDSLKRRIFFAILFFLIAIESTYGGLYGEYHHISERYFAVFFWLLGILSTIEVFHPLSRNRW
ncbi:MAG: hypothetical protein WCA21_20275 [Terracidiphilus sp.]|jgi:hypothetical protein